jgi:hypothetical protein
MELFRLFGTVLIEDQDAINALKKVDDKGKKTKSSLQDLADKGAKIGAAITAGAGIAVAGLMTLANSTADTADKWDKLSERTGISAEELQRWGYAAQQSGGDIALLETGMKKLSNSVADAQNGNAAAIASFEKLGLSVDDLNNMSMEDVFNASMMSLGNMEQGAQKNALANDLLGKTYTELMPMINEGSSGMEALKNRADELGVVMSQNSVDAGVKFGDTLEDVKASFDGVKNKIVTDLLPQLTNMLNWFIEKSPQIQDVAGKAFGFVSDTIGFIADHSNILIPVLGGLLTAFLAMKVIGIVNGLMVAYTAFTTTATGVQIGLNAALLANPIGLVIAAIGALIAIGVALYMNWDKIKAAASNLWEKITSVFNGIKNDITDRINLVKAVLEVVFGNIKDIMSKPFEAARDIIKGVIDKIKGFLNFKWEFPKLKMPHFSVTGSINPIDWIDQGVPKLSVDWYAKGGIFNRPTIFNTPYGLKGVGDAKSPEVVAPLDNLKSMLGLDKKKNENSVNVNINIDTFNNNSDKDIEELAEELAFQTKRKLEGKGGFAYA